MEPVAAGLVPSPGSVPARFGGVYGVREFQMHN